MRQLFLSVLLASTLCAQQPSAKFSQWSKKTSGNSGTLSSGGTAYYYSNGGSPYQISTWTLIVAHKVVATITKSSSDDYYTLYKGSRDPVSEWDDLAAAQSAGEALQDYSSPKVSTAVTLVTLAPSRFGEELN